MMDPNASGGATPAGTSGGATSAGTKKDEGVTEKLKEGAQRVSEQASQVQEQVVEGYHAIEDRAVELREQASEANVQIMRFIRENPGVSLGAALGVGYLLGSLAARRWIV